MLADAAEPPAELPEITGLRAVPPAGARRSLPLRSPGCSRSCRPSWACSTARIALDGDAVTLGVRDGPEVRLGLPQGVAAKGRAALAVLASTPGGPPRYIDVRVPSAPVAG